MSRVHRPLIILALLFAAGAAGAESSPEATAVLDRAIAFQGPAEVAKPGAIRDLTVRLQAEVYDHSKGSPEKQSLGINRFLVMEPERFRSEWKTSGGTDIYGYDSKPERPGLEYWYSQYSPGGELTQGTFLRGDKSADSRQRIQDEIAETRYLLRFFFLANLKGEHVRFELLPDETIEHFGRRVKTKVLRRVNEAPETSEPALTLWLDAETGALLRARAAPRTDEEKELTFSFRYDEDFQPRVKGVLFPYRIETRERDAGAEKARLTSTATVLEGGIAFNSDLDRELFVRPKPE